MTEPKQHHYVHESYLKNFASGSGQITVCDKWREWALFSVSPEKAMKIKHYYAQPLHEDKKFTSSLEAFFSTIESYWPELVQAIQSRIPLTETQREKFLEALFMLRCRVPNTRKAIEACLQHLAHDMTGALDGPVPQLFSEALSKNSTVIKQKLSCGAVVTLQDLLDERLLFATIDPHRSITLMPQFIQSLAPIFGSFGYWSFLYNETELDYLTTDNPVVYWEEDGNSVLPFPSVVRRGFRFVFPVTRRILFFYNSDRVPDKPVRSIYSAIAVRKTNTMLARFADRFVAARDAVTITSVVDRYQEVPIPDFAKSAITADRLSSLNYQWGKPISMPKWEYEF